MDNFTKAQINKALDTLAISVLVLVATVVVVVLGCLLGIAMLAVTTFLWHNPFIVVGVLLGSLISWSFIRFLSMD
jgi:hypothetical protein